jgi:hypothetical protein
MPIISVLKTSRRTLEKPQAITESSPENNYSRRIMMKK